MWPNAAWKALRNLLPLQGRPKTGTAETPSEQSLVFIPLVQDFVDKRVSAQDFETRYLRLVKDYPGLLDHRVSRAVNYLFCEVDALILDERLRDPDDRNEIDEATLRTCAKYALGALLRVGEAAEIEDSVESLIAASHSEDRDTRDRAAFLMAEWLPDPVIEQRLIQMLHDVDIAVQVCATESLVTQGGRSGLLAVLSDFGERIDDPSSTETLTRAPLSDTGKDQGEFIDAAGDLWDVKSSPDLQPSYRPDSGKPIETPQTDAKFVGMVNKQPGKGTGVLLDSEGMTAERQSHLREVVEQHPEWAGRIRWFSRRGSVSLDSM